MDCHAFIAFHFGFEINNLVNAKEVQFFSFE